MVALRADRPGRCPATGIACAVIRCPPGVAVHEPGIAASQAEVRGVRAPGRSDSGVAVGAVVVYGLGGVLVENVLLDILDTGIVF